MNFDQRNRAYRAAKSAVASKREKRSRTGPRPMTMAELHAWHGWQFEDGPAWDDQTTFGVLLKTAGLDSDELGASWGHVNHLRHARHLARAMEKS